MKLSRRNALQLMLAMSAQAQVAAREPDRPIRVGVLVPGTPATAAQAITAFIDGLRGYGYVEGKTLELHLRYAEGRVERLAPLAAELVALPVDIVGTLGVLPVQALRQASSTIPIVALTDDPVAAGFADSLARPGKNVTGIAFMGLELTVKRLDLLRRIIPGLTKVAVLWHRDGSSAGGVEVVTSAASRIDIQTFAIEVTAPAELPQAIARAKAQGAQGVLMMSSAFFNYNRRVLVESLQSQRMPAICEGSVSVVEGCLLSYAAAFLPTFARAAYFVDRIVKGTTPGDLPFEQPREFEMVINMKTAQSLGLIVPNAILLQATEVIR